MTYRRDNKIDAKSVWLFIAVFVLVCLAYILIIAYAESDAQVTWESQPINVVPSLKAAGFTPEQIAALMTAFGAVNVQATNSQRQQDETIRSLRDSVYGITPGGVTGGDTLPCYDTLNTGYIEQCTYDATNNPTGDLSTDKLILNTYALTLKYNSPHWPAYDVTTDWNPLLRYITATEEDTVEWGSGGNVFPGSRVRFVLPINTYSTANTNGRVMLWYGGGDSDGDPDGSGGTGNLYESSLFPHTGLTQSGRQAANTEQTRDTIVFATKFSDSTGGGPVGTLTSKSSAGFRFDQGVNGTADDYVAIVQWGPNDGSYFDDSLWVVSKTDSSIVIGIEWSASARVVTFIAHGYREPSF